MLHYVTMFNYQSVSQWRHEICTQPRHPPYDRCDLTPGNNISSWSSKIIHRDVSVDSNGNCSLCLKNDQNWSDFMTGNDLKSDLQQFYSNFPEKWGPFFSGPTL